MSESHTPRWAASKPQLDANQARRVEQARVLAAAAAQSLSAGYDHVCPDDAAQVFGYAYGAAQSTIRELIQVIDLLTGAAR